MVIKLTQMGSCRQEKDDIKTAQTYVVQFPHSAPTQHASQFSSQHASLLGGGSDPAGQAADPAVFRNWYQFYRILQRCTFSSGSLRLHPRVIQPENCIIFLILNQNQNDTHKQLLLT